MARGTSIAGGLLMAGLAFEALTGCANTHGEGSMITQNRGCDPTFSRVTLDEQGDEVRYAIDDLSTEPLSGSVIDALEVSVDGPEQPWGVATRVSEVAIRGVGGESAAFTQLEGEDGSHLAWSIESDNQIIRVDLDELLSLDDSTYRFGESEENSYTGMTIRPIPMEGNPALADGATISFRNNCVSQAD